MRITGGNAIRRILKVPKGFDVRPTPDLVKQAVFNSLGARVVGAMARGPGRLAMAGPSAPLDALCLGGAGAGAS